MNLELLFQTICIAVIASYVVSLLIFLLDVYTVDTKSEPDLEDCVFSYAGKYKGIDVYLFSNCTPLKSYFNGAIPCFTIWNGVEPVINVDEKIWKEEKKRKACLDVEYCNVVWFFKDHDCEWKMILRDIYCNLRYGWGYY